MVKISWIYIPLKLLWYKPTSKGSRLYTGNCSMRYVPLYFQQLHSVAPEMYAHVNTKVKTKPKVFTTIKLYILLVKIVQNKRHILFISFR